MGIFGVPERNYAFKEDTLHQKVAGLEVLKWSWDTRLCIENGVGFVLLSLGYFSTCSIDCVNSTCFMYKTKAEAQAQNKGPSDIHASDVVLIVKSRIFGYLHRVLRQCSKRNIELSSLSSHHHHALKYFITRGIELFHLTSLLQPRQTSIGYLLIIYCTSIIHCSDHSSLWHSSKISIFMVCFLTVSPESPTLEARS